MGSPPAQPPSPPQQSTASIGPAVDSLVIGNSVLELGAPASPSMPPSSSSGRRQISVIPASLQLLSRHRAPLRLPNPEADDAPVIDYVDDDPSSLSRKLPDVRDQEPDATTEACYYVEIADDQE
ncbi:uncharacterized protein LOC119332564 [Triticum dicoccoides]|uniref:uncharacterized protein LOC119332564 n=1 Tax=Triticum dicoccoides TaxID=85692 RepID=UPI0018919E93|nr:uncharacterized protein LOC119332564 [Triticum dicoccoides]